MDELSLIDHNEIMARLTLKQEVGSSQAFACRVWPRKRVGALSREPGGVPNRKAQAEC